MGFVTIGVIGKLIGGGIDAIWLECVVAAIVETDVGAVTPIIAETVIGEVTLIEFDTLAPLTGTWVDCSCVL
jgi:hypothetical protein